MPHRKHLEPAKTLSLFKDLDKIVPFLAREWISDVQLKALQVRLVFRLLLFLFFLDGATALLFGEAVGEVVGFGRGLDALTKGEVAIDDD